MRKYCFILFVLYPGFLNGQNKTVHNDSSEKRGIIINEIYLYDPESDSFPYRRREKKREWIEIYNQSSKKILVDNLFLSNDRNDLTRWPVRRWKRKNRYLKKDGLLPVYLNRSGKRKSVRADIYLNENDSVLYLSYREKGIISIVDTLVFSPGISYPWSRYPDGSAFVHTDALSPGYPNTYFNQSLPEKVKGITLHLGLTGSSSEEFQNSTRPALSGAFGFYFIKNRRLFSSEFGIRYGIRGYGIRYQTTTTTTKGVRELKTSGRQTIHYLDFSQYLNNRISSRLSIFYGGIFSIRLITSLKYDQDIVFTYFSSGQQVITTSTYKSNEVNEAIDFWDLSFVVGFRYFWSDNIQTSLYYYRDFWGVNWNEFGGKGQVGSGVFLTAEIPVFKRRTRVKSRFLWKE